jgi:hypothetical protein
VAVPTPAPEEAPAPAPAPAARAPVPRNGRIEIRGDAASVELRGGGTDHRPGWVPSGTYEIRATFEAGEAPRTVGEVTVAAGDTVVVTCKKAFLRCSTR